MLPDGTRRLDPTADPGPEWVHICVSSPGLTAQIIADWKARGAPKFLNVCENDGWAGCACPACLSRDEPDPDNPVPFDHRLAAAKKAFAGQEARPDEWILRLGSLSDRFARFWKRVAEEAVQIRPEVEVVSYVYDNCRKPPVRARLDQHVLCGVVPQESIFGYSKFDSEVFRRDWTGWERTGCALFLRPNYTLPASNFPAFYARIPGEDLKFAMAHGLKGTDFDSLTGKCSAQGPSLHMLATILNHPDASSETVVEEFCAAFGPAKDAVRQYFALWENVYPDYSAGEQASRIKAKRKYGAGIYGPFYILAGEVFTPGAMTNAWSLLAKARADAGTEALAAARVEWLAKGLRQVDLMLATERAYELAVDFNLPRDIPVGRYYVEANAHSAEFGEDWVRLDNHSEFPDEIRYTIIQVDQAPDNPTALGLGVGWANDFNWKLVVDARREFGAKGDGVADDTGAIQRALDRVAAQGGGVVRLPDDLYRVAGLTLGRKTILQGESRAGTVVMVSPVGEAAVVCKGQGQGFSSLTLKFQPEVPANHSAVVIGGEASPLFVHDVRFEPLRSPDVSVKQAPYAGQMNGFFLDEGWMGWNIYNACIAGNNAHDLNGPGDCQPYAADSAWSCLAGGVMAAGTNTVEVRSDLRGDFKGLDTHELEMVVAQGRGLGQLRRVSARRNLGGDPAVIHFTVAPAWDVPPDTTSVVSVGCWHVNNVFFRNRAEGCKSPYNMYYGGCYDCVDAEAVSLNTEGWYNWGRIGEFPDNRWHCPVYFSQLKRSEFSGMSPAYSTLGITLRVENETKTYRGIADYGTEIRDNTIDRSACSNKNQRLAGNAAIATFNQSWMNVSADTPLLFATLCEGNTIKNSAVGFDLNGSFAFTIRGTKYENCPKPITDNGYRTAILPESFRTHQ